MNDLWAPSNCVPQDAKKEKETIPPRNGNFSAEPAKREIGQGITKSSMKEEINDLHMTSTEVGGPFLLAKKAHERGCMNLQTRREEVLVGKMVCDVAL